MKRDPLPAAGDKRRAVREMFDRISGRYDLVNRIMTFGVDQRWRRRTVASLELERGARVLDLACGTGDLCTLLAADGMRPIGMDLSLGMLTHATTSAPLAQADALQLPVRSSSVDAITCGFGLRNVTDPVLLFAECARTLRRGGRAAFLEIAEPENRVLRAGHSIYFKRIMPLIGGMLSDRQAYRYLPSSVIYLPSPRQLGEMLAAAGFGDVERVLVGGGAAQIVTATKR
jgi:demethylmenaquinone methyltransferase/2-methoxy-6-polyprenyl-1,4-benzoquinol methylase